MAEQQSKPQVPRVKLGTQGLEVSKLGYGCAGLSYRAICEDHGISLIEHAFSRGVTFFDTADKYGPHTNEILVGKALKRLPREQIQVATKFGIQSIEGESMVVNGKPEYVRACCEASLKHLGVDYIDLYYQHRVDKSIPIEDTMGELKKLVEEGKVKYIGLSEASPNTIRRAHAVHPLTAVQMEWSLWSRDIEGQIVPLCRELGIGIVAYSPLGCGFFAGRVRLESLPENSLLSILPRFSGNNLERNKNLCARFDTLAEKHHCTPGQLALAWLLHQGNDVVPIPGTTKFKNLDENIDSVNVKLTEEELNEISEALPVDEVAGERMLKFLVPYSWQVADTPPKCGEIPA